MLERVDISGCKTWKLKGQEGAMALLRNFIDLFAKDDLNLGKTMIIKQKIKLKEGAKPFKDRS